MIKQENIQEEADEKKGQMPIKRNFFLSSLKYKCSLKRHLIVVPKQVLFKNFFWLFWLQAGHRKWAGIWFCLRKYKNDGEPKDNFFRKSVFYDFIYEY